MCIYIGNIVSFLIFDLLLLSLHLVIHLKRIILYYSTLNRFRIWLDCNLSYVLGKCIFHSIIFTFGSILHTARIFDSLYWKPETMKQGRNIISFLTSDELSQRRPDLPTALCHILNSKTLDTLLRRTLPRKTSHRDETTLSQRHNVLATLPPTVAEIIQHTVWQVVKQRGNAQHTSCTWDSTSRNDTRARNS